MMQMQMQMQIQILYIGMMSTVKEERVSSRAGKTNKEKKGVIATGGREDGVGNRAKEGKGRASSSVFDQ